MAQGDFPNCLPVTFAYEGGLSMIRFDPGNWTGGKVGVGALNGTNFGIAASSHPTLDIKALTRAEAGRDLRARVLGPGRLRGAANRARSQPFRRHGEQRARPVRQMAGEGRLGRRGGPDPRLHDGSPVIRPGAAQLADLRQGLGRALAPASRRPSLRMALGTGSDRHGDPREASDGACQGGDREDHRRACRHGDGGARHRACGWGQSRDRRRRCRAALAGLGLRARLHRVAQQRPRRRPHPRNLERSVRHERSLIHVLRFLDPRAARRLAHQGRRADARLRRRHAGRRTVRHDRRAASPATCWPTSPARSAPRPTRHPRRSPRRSRPTPALLRPSCRRSRTTTKTEIEDRQSARQQTVDLAKAGSEVAWGAPVGQRHRHARLLRHGLARRDLARLRHADGQPHHGRHADGLFHRAGLLAGVVLRRAAQRRRHPRHRYGTRAGGRPRRPDAPMSPQEPGAAPAAVLDLVHQIGGMADGAVHARMGG